MNTALSQGFLEAQGKLATYSIRGQLEAQPRDAGYWLFDYWRDSMIQQWEITTIAEGLTEQEALVLGAFIHPNYRSKS